MALSIFRGYDQILKQVRRDAIAKKEAHLEWLLKQANTPAIVEHIIAQTRKDIRSMKEASHRSDMFKEMLA